MVITHNSVLAASAMMFAMICGHVAVAALPTMEWSRQLGTLRSEGSFGVSADRIGNVYISGITDGSLGGPRAGEVDAFVAKYDAAGNFQWVRQLGNAAGNVSDGVSADGLGNVYISGTTGGNLGGTSADLSDAFLSKYDPFGTHLWTRQLGTSANDESSSVSADAFGNVYISGRTEGSLGGPLVGGTDAYISKYNAAGVLQWTRQLGTSNDDNSRGVSADGLGNVYISGITSGNLGGTIAGDHDAFISKYDAAGNLQWSRQLGTSDVDASSGVSADGLGNVYISGVTTGNLGGTYYGSYDAFVSKYDAAGNLQWSRQLGTGAYDESFSVSADGLGNVYISGRTTGSLGGPYAGDTDAFVSKYDSAGNPQWTLQVGTLGVDVGHGVSADGLGNIYLSGSTTYNLGGHHFGNTDAYLMKFRDIPEPSLLPLVWSGCITTAATRRTRRRRRRTSNA